MLDDLLQGARHKRRSDHSRYEDHPEYGHEKHGHYNPVLEIGLKLFRNKAILAGVALTILIIGAAGVWLVVTLLPYLSQVVSMAGKILEQQGIKGILEAITPLLQKIWEGAGK